MTVRRALPVLAALLVAGCVSGGGLASGSASVADTPTRATTPGGNYITWREHLVDDEGVNGGLALRGGDGLQIADIDRDGFMDIVSVHEDSHHLRIAFGSADPDRWDLVTVASGDVVAAIEDVAVGDLDGDGWPDLVAASEEAHLAYFHNPGSSAAAREGGWRSAIPRVTQGRGSWLRVFVADIDGDGRADVVAANKGASDIVDPSAPRADRTTSLFMIAGDPLDGETWQEQVLFARDVPNTAMPVDIDGDGDLDILAAARLDEQMYVLENKGVSDTGSVEIAPHPVVIGATGKDAPGCTVSSGAFQSQFRDLGGDGRLDLVVAVTEKCGDPRAPGGLPALAWLRQPTTLDGTWDYHRIGDIRPDAVIAIELADIDGDGDLDAVTGGYSGLNILRGGYTPATREEDHPHVTSASTVGRIAWFANPGDPAGEWTRHDISRRVRGMFDQFIARDMDGDGDLDLVGTRGNSGAFDGVFWLEQVRSPRPVRSFRPAREDESRALPLPPADWIDRYERDATLVPPNKRGDPAAGS
ncbi:FG-GAP repeat domain-containing protein [Pelagerythrobacter sp.]|uniref:FG-GAP repeat domain-containing protein n=1 Tax=Pelagerythrobacter sp. TaxID=2800702 RepID=UPI0035B32281